MTITYSNFIKTSGLALAALVLLVLPVSAAKAADLDLGGYSYDYYVPDSGYSYDYYVPDTGYSYDYYVPDTSSSGYSYDYYVPDTSSYSYPSYSYGSGYSVPTFSYGSGYSYPSFSTPSNTTIVAPTTVANNGNSCTAPNTCNTSYDDHSIFNAPTTVTVASAQPSVVYQPSYVPTCTGCGCYNNCYTPPVTTYYNPPVAYNNTPYVTLSAVPYTGLELGFWGTIAYWSFLVLWCLVAAYLIVVKRVQSSLVAGLNSFLFGSSSAKAVHAPAVSAAKAAPAEAKAEPVEEGIDPFILSQIKRA